MIMLKDDKQKKNTNHPKDCSYRRNTQHYRDIHGQHLAVKHGESATLPLDVYLKEEKKREKYKKKIFKQQQKHLAASLRYMV